MSGGVQGIPGGVLGGPEEVLGRKTLRSKIQDFVQEVLVPQMAQGTPFQCLPLLTPSSPISRCEGGKGEVKPPKCPTRHQGSAEIYIYIHMLQYICIYVYVNIYICMYIYIFREYAINNIYLDLDFPPPCPPCLRVPMKFFFGFDMVIWLGFVV